MLERKVGDDLVGVHVGGGACPTLDHIDHELRVQLPRTDFLARLDDDVRLFAVEQSELVVSERSRLLDAGQRANQVGIDRDRSPGNGEILDGAQRVHTVIGCCGNRAIAASGAAAAKLRWTPYRFRS